MLFASIDFLQMAGGAFWDFTLEENPGISYNFLRAIPSALQNLQAIDEMLSTAAKLGASQ